MGEKAAEYLKKLERPLEVLGMALLLTAAQIAVYHIVFSDRLAGYYIVFYEDYIKGVNIVYSGYIMLLTKIFGSSYTNVLYNFYEKMFILIFIVNLGYFAVSAYQRAKKPGQ